MSVRTLSWRDLPTLHRFRQQSVFLDSTLLLTRGPLLFQGALLSSLAPGIGVSTCVANVGKTSKPVFGQFIHSTGSQHAHLTFLAPDSAVESTSIRPLLEYMAQQSGERGAFRLLADVEENTGTFDALRQVGYAIYSRQRIWQLVDQLPNVNKPDIWRTTSNRDTAPIRNLYHSLVPGLVQQVEPHVVQNPKGMVYYHQGELLAFVELRYGRRGVWVHPFVHPNAEDVANHLMDLLLKIPDRNSRPIYICVRSYQSWLESSIAELGAQASPQQAVMVKHLAKPQKALPAFGLPALDSGQPEITTPIVHSESK